MIVATYARGSYTYELALELFPQEEILVRSNPAEVIIAVSSGAAQVGLIPFFNLSAGTEGVPVPYRLLLESDISVHKVIPKPISLSLAAVSGTRLEDIQRLFLMKVLRRQCDYFVQHSLPHLREIIDDGILSTPSAFIRAKEAGHGAAAIGPRRAAVSAGLEIIVDGIENPGNTTYFFLIGKSPSLESGRSLICCEMAAELSQKQAIDAVSGLWRERNCLVSDFWLEDKGVSGEQNHLSIVEVELPEYELNPMEVGVDTPELLSWRIIGRIPPWR